MAPPSAAGGDPRENGELEFFGVKLKVKNPSLAALLNSSVNEDVQVIGARAREAFSGADDARADDSVRIRLDGVEDA
jgi:hypothetical protein